MERFSSQSVRDTLRGSRKSTGYNGNYYDPDGLSSGNATPTRKNMKSVRFGDVKNTSPSSKGTRSNSTIWRKMKDGYYNMMISLGGNGVTAFGDKRVPKARKVPDTYAASEFDKRLVQEIYKSMSTTS